MSHMSKLVTGVALGTSGGTILNGVLTKLSPDEWSAVGVLAGIAGIIITGLINWYFKLKVANAQVDALTTLHNTVSRAVKRRVTGP